MENRLREQLTVREKGSLLSTICLDFTVYTKSNFFAEGCTEGILDFYNQVIELYGNNFQWYLTENSTGPKKIEEKTLEMFPFWMSGKSKKRTEYILELRNGEKKDKIGTIVFEATTFGKAEGPCFLRLSLPTDMFAQGFDEYRTLCIKLTKKLPFLSGRAGYSLRWSEDDIEFSGRARKHVKLISRRFPGIDIPEDSMTIYEPSLLTGIRPVNWLTLLSPPFIEKLGGLEKLKADLGEDIPVFELPHGVMIQAGPEPDTGDLNKRNFLPFYHRVGKVLKPIRMQSHRPIVEDMDEWLERFDKDPEM